MATRRVQEKKWEIEEAAKTLMRAEEIRANRQLLSQAKKELAKQHNAVERAIGKNKK